MNIGGFFDDLNKYVYITKEAANIMTPEEVKELEQFDKKH